MTPRENLLRAVRFEEPDHIPMQFVINASCWHHYDASALFDLMGAHPLLFPGFRRPDGEFRPDLLPNARAGIPYVDPWGCVWRTTDDGIVGTVHDSPIRSWENLAAFRPPDPAVTDGLGPIDWTRAGAELAAAKRRGEPAIASLPHGHTFLRLQDLRGYEGLLFDMTDGHPDLGRLIDMVADFNLGCVRRWLDLGPDMLQYPEDLGMQAGPMLPPELFREYIKPVYRRLMGPAKERGVLVHMHSDGDIRTLADDILECGVDVINPQDLVNGIDWLAKHLAGRVCIDLDIDRQKVTPFGTPRDIDDLIREEVQKLGSRRGGLLMVYGLYPGVPLANVAAIMDAMERYSGLHS